MHPIQLLIFSVCLLNLSFLSAQTVGEALPDWTPGILDIHEISTGRGCATFCMLPDGTTMLYDAGEIHKTGDPWRWPRYLEPRPDSSRTSGDWITRYLQRLLQQAPAQQIDYALPSHFHGDHMGWLTKSAPQSEKGDYQLSGLTWVGDKIPIKQLIDRAYPDYNYPVPLTNRMMQNYRAFQQWQIEQNGMKASRFLPGRNDQIVLQHEPEAYPTFEVRNLAANGEVWTGVASVTRAMFPKLEDLEKLDFPNENLCSIALRMSYGKFDYYTGGDLYGIPKDGAPAWHDMETPVAKAVGPVEVAVLNHHGYIDSQNEFFVSTLRPRTWILPVWESGHPGPRVYKRLRSTNLYPGPRDIFSTHMHEATKLVVVGLNQLASDRGHIVVRVTPGGDSYQVIILDDSDESGRITAIHGPYETR